MFKLPILYKLCSNNKINTWQISYDISSNIPFYSVEHGYIDGQKQQTLVEILKGKNIGKSNETSAQEQCALEANSLWVKQKDRKGYSTEIPKSKPFRPMLAKVYKDEYQSLKFPCFVQPKLNGVRLISNGGNLISRTGKEFYGLEHISKVTSNIPHILDGELYIHGESLQTIVSLVRKSVNLDEQSQNLKYHIYDIVDSQHTFSQRLDVLNSITGDNIIIVPTHEVFTHKEIDQYQKQYIEDGYEGLIVRTDSHYKINGRSAGLLKYKNFIDEEFEIVNYCHGKGKYQNVPIFTLKSINGLFEAVPIGTQEERFEMLNNASNLIGKMATVKYFELTKDGLPHCPVLLSIRDYE